MIKRPILTVLLAMSTFFVTAGMSIANDTNMKASVLDDFLGIFEGDITPLQGDVFTPVKRIDPDGASLASMDLTLNDNVVMGKWGEWTYCDYEATTEEDVQYGVEYVSTSVDENIVGGGTFTVSVEFKNTGNVRLFGEDSGCSDENAINLGTQMEQDRNSEFGGNTNAVSGWLSANRVKMVEEYADPGETLHFQFESKAPVGDNIYREWFQPVIEWTAWVGEPVYVDIAIDEPTESMYDNISFARSVTIDAAQLEGLARNLEVDLSEQTMYAKMGDIVIWKFKISSGKADTPTPIGNYQVLNKQELRVGGEYPHYRMPYWQGWRTDGYGLHALPYLANDGGAFWQEAYGHIGIPVSHGCIRQLPEDAKTLYDYTEIGTPVYVHS